MVKFLKFIAKSILIVVVLVLLWMNYAMYHNPSFSEEQGVLVNTDVVHQLNFLEAKLKAGEGAKMQRLFPEGFVFINVLYGLTWCNVLQGVDSDTELYKRGVAEIDRTLAELHSEKCTQIFPEDLPLPYGAFHFGWTTYLQGNRLALQPEGERDTAQVLDFKYRCTIIAEAIGSSELPYLESYRGQIWPADMMTSIASLKIHDSLFDELYAADRKAWIAESKLYFDPETGLIPHSIGDNFGVKYGKARGSSQSLILTFLFEIDSSYAADQYKIYKDLFLTTRFGLPGVLEYPDGDIGSGDIDSGPVILGVGGSASIVGQRLAGIAEDWNTYAGLRNSVELFGAAYTFKENKKYVFGQLPMADAFIAWSNSIETSPRIVQEQSDWRWKFQLWTAGLAVVLMGMLYATRGKSRPDKSSATI